MNRDRLYDKAIDGTILTLGTETYDLSKTEDVKSLQRTLN